MIPFLDKTIVKIMLISAIIASLIGVYKWHHDNIFQAGADSVKAEMKEAYELREKELNTSLVNALADNETQKQLTTKLYRKIQELQTEDRKIRDEIFTTDYDCDSFGADFFGLWNKTIGSNPDIEH
jgi:predicted HTH transcriptional regulator